MATALQTAANQRNAQKSTGPKTDEGKSRSRANALKDGLTGNGTVLTPAQEDAVAARMEAWRSDYNPEDEQEQWLYRRLVVSTVQLDQIEAEEHRIRGELRDRACLSWDVDRRLEVETLGARLASNPAINQLKLLRSAQGCLWLKERWDTLIAALEPAEDGQPGVWTDEQESLVLDLCGTAGELRIEGRRPWELTGDASALALATAEREFLAQRHEALLELDERDRARAESGHAAVDSPADRAIWRLRRLDQACWRTFLWARNQLPANPPSVPAPEPLPLPTPPPAPRTPEKRTHCDTGSRLPVAATKAPVGPRPSAPIDPSSINLTAMLTGKPRL